MANTWNDLFGTHSSASHPASAVPPPDYSKTVPDGLFEWVRPISQVHMHAKHNTSMQAALQEEVAKGEKELRETHGRVLLVKVEVEQKFDMDMHIIRYLCRHAMPRNKPCKNPYCVKTGLGGNAKQKPPIVETDFFKTTATQLQLDSFLKLPKPDALGSILSGGV